MPSFDLVHSIINKSPHQFEYSSPREGFRSTVATAPTLPGAIGIRSGTHAYIYNWLDLSSAITLQMQWHNCVKFVAPLSQHVNTTNMASMYSEQTDYLIAMAAWMGYRKGKCALPSTAALRIFCHSLIAR